MIEPDLVPGPAHSTEIVLAVGTGGLALAAELVDVVRAELPAVAELDEREQLLVSAWLLSLPSARTRRAYFSDVQALLRFLEKRDVDVLAAGRVHLDLWRQLQLAAGAEATTVRRRLSGISSFYKYLATQGLVSAVPTVGVERPNVDANHSDTVGLSREETRALLAAADADTGPQRLRTRVVIRLQLINALRVDEMCGADVDDLGYDRGQPVLDILGKGGKKDRVPMVASVYEALTEYLDAVAAGLGVPVGELSGPLLRTRTGGRMRQSQLWELIRRLARAAGIKAWDQLSPHSSRHTAITMALDAGVPLRDAQDFARHRDPRTTRRYDRSRDRLDRNAAYTVAAYLT